MANTITFSGACSVKAPVVCDPSATPAGTGVPNSGIGLVAVDGTLVPASYIGGPAFNLRVETDANLATP